MSRHSGITSRSSRKTGGGFGLLVILWANLVVTPCAMALEAEHDCPRDPATEEQSQAGHHGHVAAEAEQPCAELVGECCDKATIMVDSRSTRQQSDDGSGVVAMPADDYETLIDYTGVCFVSPVRPPDPPGRRTSLHVLHCVFLD